MSVLVKRGIVLLSFTLLNVKERLSVHHYLGLRLALRARGAVLIRFLAGFLYRYKTAIALACVLCLVCGYLLGRGGSARKAEIQVSLLARENIIAEKKDIEQLTALLTSLEVTVSRQQLDGNRTAMHVIDTSSVTAGMRRLEGLAERLAKAENAALLREFFKIRELTEHDDFPLGYLDRNTLLAYDGSTGLKVCENPDLINRLAADRMAELDTLSAELCSEVSACSPSLLNSVSTMNRLISFGNSLMLGSGAVIVVFCINRVRVRKTRFV